MVSKLLAVLTSLKLTVLCLAVAVILVFIGTIAQVDQGLYRAQELYFKSFLIYWPGTGFPVFPGGYTVGTVLLVNLLAAHGKRFQFSRKKFGIFLTHVGLILLLLGQLFTDLLSRESALHFEEGESKNYSVDFRKNELALIDRSDKRTETIVSVPESLLDEGAVLKDDRLPFRVRVHQHWPNLDVRMPNPHNEKPTGFFAPTADRGGRVWIRPRPSETAMDQRDNPGATIELLVGERSLGTWFVSTLLKPSPLDFDNRKYDVVLRHRRYYEPFSLTLIKATHDVYKGTEVPKNFSSRVRLLNPETRVDRETLIYMNYPLRYGGLTFYQHQMAANEMVTQSGLLPSSTLQVVRNPTWLTPYLACLLVGAGLIIQFAIHLVGFLRKQRTKVRPGTAPPSGGRSKRTAQDRR